MNDKQNKSGPNPDSRGVPMSPPGCQDLSSFTIVPDSVTHTHTHTHTHEHTHTYTHVHTEEVHGSVRPLGVFEHVDACEDLERRTQFDVHGAHEVVLLQEQQGLAVDLLGPELVRYLLAACAWKNTTSIKKTHLSIVDGEISKMGIMERNVCMKFQEAPMTANK